MRLNGSILVSLSTLLVAGVAAFAETEPQATSLKRLRQAILTASTLAEAEQRVTALPIELGASYRVLPAIAVQGQKLPAWEVRFSRPVDAAALAAGLGFSRPCAISDDASSGRWTITEAFAFVPTGLHTARVAARTPVLGAWEVRPRLLAQPSGPYSRVTYLAYPAYPLSRYAAQVTHLDLRPPAAKP